MLSPCKWASANTFGIARSSNGAAPYKQRADDYRRDSDGIACHHVTTTEDQRIEYQEVQRQVMAMVLESIEGWPILVREDIGIKRL
jgi:hypothetical protein